MKSYRLESYKRQRENLLLLKLQFLLFVSADFGFFCSLAIQTSWIFRLLLLVSSASRKLWFLVGERDGVVPGSVADSESVDNLYSTSVIHRLFFLFLSDQVTAMAKNLNTGLDFSCVDEKKNSEKILVSDHADGFQCRTESDSFFISIASLANGSLKEDTANFRTTRSSGRNGFLRSSLQKITSKIAGESEQPKDSPCLNHPVKSPAMAVGQKHHHQSNQQLHHQIAITAGSMNNPISGSGSCEKRNILRRNSFKRSVLKFILKPRNVAIFFATVSSVGSILLLYFVITIRENVLNEDDVVYFN